MYVMEISVTFLLTGCLIQGVFCVFEISLPKRVEALQGSCVFIPCTFDIDQEYEFYLTDSTKRMWYKDGDPATLVFDSSRPDTGLLKGEIFGTPTEKNCTTRFDNVLQSHNGSYFFRVETSGQLKFSYRKPDFSQVKIAVRDSPPKPTVSLLKDQQEVTEGSSVNLRCSSKIFCPFSPAFLTWSSSPEHLLSESVTQQQRQEQTELISDLIFNVTHRHHLATFTCTVTHQQQITKHVSRRLHVQYAPKNTSVHVSPSGFVVEGGSVTLSCSSDANPPVLNYTWYRDTEEPLKPEQTGQNLTISNTDPTHRGRYVCRAQNEHGAQNASVQLDVQFAPKISSSCNISSVIICVCEAHGNPSPKLEWRLSGNALANSTNTSIWNETLESTGLKSVLIIRQPLTDMTLLQCFSANTHGTTSHQFHPIASNTETRFHHPSVLLGAAVGASAMMILCIMVVCYERGRNPKPSGTRQDDTSGLILAQTATASDGDGEFVHANKDMLSAVTPRSPESLHYSSIDFTNAELASGEIRGASSLTDEYAVVRHRSASATDPNQDQSPKDKAKITDVSSEETIYENMTHRLVV